MGGRSRKLLMCQCGLLELDLAGTWMRKALYREGEVKALLQGNGKGMKSTQNCLKQSWAVLLSLSSVLLQSSCALIERKLVAWCHQSYLKITNECVFTNLCICSRYYSCSLIANGRHSRHRHSVLWEDLSGKELSLDFTKTTWP